jgi:hypothetical protein
MVILIDSHPQHGWLANVVESRYRIYRVAETYHREVGGLQTGSRAGVGGT